MLLTVREFKNQVAEDLSGLVLKLQDLTGRFGEEEAAAWKNSLPVVSSMLSAKALEPLHVWFGGSGHASLEYQLPAASSWCDMVLLGANDNRDAALVLELKHWATAGNEPGSVEGLMLRSGTARLHPSKQVAGYTEYIRRFHSEVQVSNATVNGCVIFTRSGSAGSYRADPNHLLAANYPVFTSSVEDVERAFPNYLSRLITQPSESFARRFVEGRYKQDRGFVAQIGAQILNPSSSPFVLLDNQERAFLLCKERVARVLDGRDGQRPKHVVVVHGPPGSGKSVVAAKLWASLVTDKSLKEGDVVITTTSASQNSNWVHLVEQAANRSGSGGVIKKAAQYHPISTVTVGRLRRAHGKGLFDDAVAWRTNLQLLRNLSSFQSGAEDDGYLVSLVDEAHALINPEHSAGRGQFGFAPTLGPQAYHIIRASQVVVFFMDADQGFRERENTAVQDLRQWAKELGASFDEIDLSGTQFRCAGSKEYVEWIDTIRSNAHPGIAGRHAMRWREQRLPIGSVRPSLAVREMQPEYSTGRTRGMELLIWETPADMEDILRRRLAEGYSCRLLSSYHRPWRTVAAPQPHKLPAALQDFCISYSRNGEPMQWARPWNYVPEKSGDYTLYVQARAGSAMADDPLCEVGCPYAVRGFDFDYVGLLWGSDLVWRSNRWVVQPEHVFETGIKTMVSRAKKESDVDGPMHSALLKRVWQAYRILLSRAIRGVGVWVEDEETRNYLKKATVQA